MAFLRRAERMLARADAAPGVDYGVLLATLGAHQAASATARAAAAAERRPSWERPGDALAELLAGGPAWRHAVRAQRGTFNLRAAAARVNGA